MNPIIDSEAAYALRVFLFACLLGGVLSVFYGVFKILRIAIRFSAAAVAVQDFVFWFFSGLAVFMFALWQNDGIVRGYVLFGAVIGALFYYWTVGTLITRSAEAIVGFFRRISGKIKNGARSRAAMAKMKIRARRQRRNMKKARINQDKAQRRLKKEADRAQKPGKTIKPRKKRRKPLEFESKNVV